MMMMAMIQPQMLLFFGGSVMVSATIGLRVFAEAS
jgi:hypothetical protein